MANKKGTNKKANTKAKPKSAKAPKQYVLTEKEKKLKNEIKLLLALALTALMELSCLGFLSPLGDYVSYFIFGCFGILGYIMPIVLFFGIAFLLSNINNKTAVVKFSAGVVFVFLLCAVIHLIFVGYSSVHGAGYYYLQCGRDKRGGGLIGSFISNSLCRVVGMAGTYIILLLLIIVCMIIITEKSFIGGVKRGGRKIYKTAVSDVKNIRDTAESYSREKNYRKNRRINKKVKGVALTKISDPSRQKQDMHEITEGIPENVSIYRGKVDIENKDKKEEVYDEVKESIIKDTYKDEGRYAVKDMYEPEPPYEDEEGLFKPKERVEVSEAAKNVMARKVYGASSSTAERSSAREAEVNYDSREIGKKSHSQGKKSYVLPKTNLLNKGTRNRSVNEIELRETALTLKNIFKNFGVTVDVTEYHKGPSVTRYEVQPEIGTRLSKITALADDIKLNLAATDIRIEPIPGKSTIGIEVPNKSRESVLIRDLIESSELMNNKSKIAFAAGMDIAGNVVVGDIAKMPHMLVAGTTGSGKSVFTNSIIMSILFRATPDEVRLIIVDPKVVEFGVYNGIPHLLQPVVTDPRLASNTLKWAVNEMSERYKKFADINVRDLKGYNAKIGDDSEKMPQIVIVIDELADLMMVAAKEVEESICRLAQLARAAGIHLIIATQRPSVDVVTGLIKANIPSRVALMVSSGVDSRTIIDSNGAEKLLGNGDMLFYPSGYVKPVRLQGAFVSDSEVQKVVDFWKAQAGEVTYDDRVAKYVASQPPAEEQQERGSGDGRDEYFAEAAKFCIEREKASTSMLQRMFKIGFNRASRIIEQLEAAGVIGAEEGTKPRKVLVTQEEFEQMLMHGKEEV